MSLLFDNVDDYAITATPPVTAAPFTISAWVKNNSTGAVQDFIAYLGQTAISTQTDCYALVMDATSSYLNAYAADATGNHARTSVAMARGTDTWQHVVGVWPSAGGTRYSVIDGNWATKGSQTTLKTAATPTHFGIGADIGGTTTNFWNGLIGHVAVWNAALSQTQIESLAAGANPASILPGNLIAYWPMTSSVSPGADSIGSNTLTLNGGLGYNADEPPVSSITVARLAAPLLLMMNS